MYHAINKGIQVAKGEVIIWINSDDILDKNAVLNVSNFFKKNSKVQWISGINGYIKKNLKFLIGLFMYSKYAFCFLKDAEFGILCRCLSIC